MSNNQSNQVHRIIIIDDNEAIHDDFRRILVQSDEDDTLSSLENELFGDGDSAQTGVSTQKLGCSFELSSAFQGQDGFEMVLDAREAGQAFALAFVDMRMPPGWDGLETIRRIFEVDPLIQVVICTAFSDHSWFDIIQEVGRSDRLLILKKPFDNVEVSQLATALSEKTRLAEKAALQMSDLQRLVEERTSDLRQANALREQAQAEAMNIERQLLHREKLESLGRLAGGISHEFRHQLAVIQSYVELARGSDAISNSPAEREMLDVVLEATHNANEMTRRILDFSRSETSETVVIDVATTVVEIHEMLTPMLGCQYSINLEIAPGKLSILGETTFLEQVLLNLCTNARDAMPQGGAIDIRVQLAPSTRIPKSANLTTNLAQNATVLLIEVEDQGCGIGKSEIHKVLTPFFTTKQRGHGTGLGLATVNTLVQRHNGMMEVKSSEGKGTTIRVYLPLEKSSQFEVAASNPIVIGEQASVNKMLAASQLASQNH
ncbi:ATP-binding protein [Aureliella helgolandensis]|uniref:histidine kinase n=1 Tax=Aureliella helgolandensis TaxID=2527968 RepID=A0A518G970_9BACT|nr:ATP-binding protein [Aureliella helgolandensis]QDV25131.1 Wide host range VirA protein [Aureliella helgolandensis]